MKHLLLILSLILIACPSFALQKYQNWCMQGNAGVLPDPPNTLKYQQSFPVCTVTVYISNTATKATLYSDNSQTPLSNPFVNQSSLTGQFFFYVDNGTYDIQLQASGLTTYTLGGIVLADPNPVINVQSYPGSDTFAKINAALGSSVCTNGCMLSDGLGLGQTETESSGPIAIGGKAVQLVFNGIFTWSSAAISGGLIQISGLAASGTFIQCNGYPQNIAYEQINVAIPCGIKYLPSTGSGPLLTISEFSNQAINDVRVSNMSFVVNSNVTDVVQYGALGNGMGAMKLDHISIINDTIAHGWSGAGIHLVCTNSGSSSNAEYAYFNFDLLSINSNGSAINGGLGGTTSSGIILDPTLTSHNCGTLGPVELNNALMEGLTGQYGINLTAVTNVDIYHPIVNSNNLAANGRGIQVSSGACGSGVNIINPLMSDNDWSGNGGVYDIASAGACGLKIIGGYLNGGSAGTSHAEDRAIDLDGATQGVVIEGVHISNLKTYGTGINTGAIGVRYCDNMFSVGNGSAAEFSNSLAAMQSSGCAIFGNATDVTMRLSNLIFPGRSYDLDSKSDGTFNVRYNGNPVLTFTTNNTATFISGPVVPFNGATAQNVPVIMTFNGTQDTGKVHIAHGLATLNGASPSTVTVTLTGNAVFTGSTTFACTATDNSGSVAVAISLENISGTQLLLTGPNGSVDQVAIICVGF